MPDKRELPRYKCHKEVWALKIAIVQMNADRSARISPADDGYGTFTTEPGWGSRFHGNEDDPGYYIVYEDGFKSWSPSKAFEDGYARL